MFFFECDRVRWKKKNKKMTVGVKKWVAFPVAKHQENCTVFKVLFLVKAHKSLQIITAFLLKNLI